MIDRFNQLIEVLETRLSSFSNGNGATGTWNFKVPESLDNNIIELYYLNTSDHLLRSNAQTSLSDEDLIATYNSTDFAPGATVDFSSHVANNGVGYYFWLFKFSDTAYKNDSWCIPTDHFPKGVARNHDQFFQVQVQDTNSNFYNLQRISPLLISMPTGSATIHLYDRELIIG